MLKIKVIAPSSICSNAYELLETVKTRLYSQNIELVISKNIFADPDLPFFASSYEFRKQDLTDAITSSEYQIIWSFRGGYGSSNLVDTCLDIRPFCSKVLIGFSDITALHLVFNQLYNMPSIHGCVITSFHRNNFDFTHFRPILTGAICRYELSPINLKNTSPVSIAGKIIGGNLTVFNSLIGTVLHPNASEKILLLEDVNEKGYAVHRHLMHLKQAKILDNVQAILFGDFTLGDNLVSAAVSHFCRSVIPDIPCFNIKRIGHSEYNDPIVLGTAAKIIDERTLEILSPFNFIDL